MDDLDDILKSDEAEMSALVRIAGTNMLIKKPEKAKYNVIDEEAYIGGISTIIERDFFPNLKKMKMQTDFLQAVDEVDLLKATQIKGQLAKMDTPVQTPMHTPVTNSYISDSLEGKEPSIPTNMSLDSFMANYTSQDNSSFSLILEKASEEKRKRYDWAYNAEKKLVLLNKDEPLMIQDSQTLQVDKQGYIQTWVNHVPINHLMFGANHCLLPVPEEPSRSHEKKSINHTATRFNQSTVSTKNILQNEPSAQSVFNDVLGSKDEFVPSTPLLIPGKDIDPNIQGTPLLLDNGSNSSSKGPSFTLPPTPRREEIGMRLSEQAAKNIRQRTAQPKLTDSARGRLIGMSPAAQNLLQKVKKNGGDTPRMSLAAQTLMNRVQKKQ